MTCVDGFGISGKTIGTDNNDYLGFVIWFDAGSNYDSRTNSLDVPTLKVYPLVPLLLSIKRP